MKAFKIEVLVIDFERIGEAETIALLKENKYLNVNILDVKSAEIGEWSDEHPLNFDGTMKAEADRIFPNEVAPIQIIGTVPVQINYF